MPHVQLGKDTQVRLYSSGVNEPIMVRTRGLGIRFHKEISDGKEYICATITPRKGKPLGLMRHLMQVVPPGGKVLDPFAGGGATLVAPTRWGWMPWA